MGITIALSNFYAVECPRTVFWENTGETRAFCSGPYNYRTDHVISTPSKFCPECGAKIKTEAVERPTQVLLEFADHSRWDPREAFKALEEEDGGCTWAAGDEANTMLKLGWFSIDPFKSGYSEYPATMGLGFVLGWDIFGSSRRRSKFDYTLAELAIYHTALLDVKKLFSLPAEPKIYSQVYAS
jgi:hypothetical protein